jgi:hypothetical protein
MMPDNPGHENAGRLAAASIRVNQRPRSHGLSGSLIRWMQHRLRTAVPVTPRAPHKEALSGLRTNRPSDPPRRTGGRLDAYLGDAPQRWSGSVEGMSAMARRKSSFPIAVVRCLAAPAFPAPHTSASSGSR